MMPTKKVPLPRVDPMGMDAYGMPSKTKRFCYDCLHCLVGKKKMVTCRYGQWKDLKGKDRLLVNLMNGGGMQLTARDCRFYDYMG